MTSKATKWVRERIATGPAIYGLVVFSVLVASISDEVLESFLEGTDLDELDAIVPGSERMATLGVTVATVLSFLIFYVVHVYAETIARHGDQSLKEAVVAAKRHSAGMLYTASLPTLVLIIWLIGGWSVENASIATLGVAMLVLAYVSYEAAAQRGARVVNRVLTALVSAIVGAVIIILDYLFR